MLTTKKNIVFAFFAVLVFSFLVNTVNITYIRNHTGNGYSFVKEDLVFNQTIYSVDNSWYLPQTKNFMAGKGFTCDTTEKKYLVRRTPVYPLFYGIHYLLFGGEKSFFFIKISQTILFTLSSIAFLFAVFYLTNNKKIAWLAFFLYGFNPTLISYTYYTLTESLSPALISFMLYFFAKAIKFNSTRNWFLCGVFFSLGALCRPTIFIFAGSLALAICFLYYKDFKRLATVTFAFGLALSLFFIPYVIRNYIATKGDFVLLEKYYNDPMYYGMQNIELRKWISTWMNPADYSSEVISNKMMDHILNKEDKNTLIDSLVTSIPNDVYSNYDKPTVTAIFYSVYGYYDYRVNGSIPKNLDSAQDVSVRFIRQKTDNFKSNNRFKFYVLMPAKILKSIIFQSNSGTLFFLNDYQKNIAAFIIKLFLVLLNIFLFLSLAGNLFFIRKYFLVYSVLLSFIGVNCGYMLFIINYFEVRYLVPLFPLMYISGAIFATEAVAIVRKQLNF